MRLRCLVVLVMWILAGGIAFADPARGLWYNFDARVQPEAYDFFAADAAHENAYGFVGIRTRSGVGYEAEGWQVGGQLQTASLFGLPRGGVSPAPAGSLGQGGSYEAVALRGNLTTLGVRYLYARLGKVDGSGLQIGRFDYSDGLEATSRDATVAWLKRERIAKLLVGAPDYSIFSRSFDGVRGDVDTKPVRFTALVVRPTQAEPHFATDVRDVTGYHFAATFKEDALVPHGEGQLFYDRYDDTRRVPQVDDRPSASRGTVRAEGGNHVSTVGFHYVTRIGEDGDAVLWAAHQFGRWGRQTHGANAFVAETGLRLRRLPWSPWLRVGYRGFSGDGNPLDGKHGTFVPEVSDPRTRFPIYTNANLRDLLAQVMLQPGPRTNVRLDLHWYALDNPADLWYVGSGVTQERGSNGLTGRPSGGSRDIGTYFDLTLEHKLDAHNTLLLRWNQAYGGRVLSPSFPRKASGSVVYFEYHYLLP